MDITTLTKQAKAAKKAFKKDKENKDLKKAYKVAKKKLADAEAAKAAAEAAAKAAAEKKEESSDSEEESDSDSEEEEEKTGPTLEELKAAMKEAKKAFKADKTNKDLKKAFKAAKKAYAEKEAGGSAAAATPSKKRKRDAEEDEEAAPAKKAKEEETEDAGMKIVDNSKASSNPMANEKLFIGNLSFDIDDDGIKAFFKDCGELTDVFWLKDRDTDRFKGCGFVTFETVDAACKAVEKNGQELMGREIRIDFAKPRPGGNKPKKSREARPLSEKPDGCLTVFCGNLSFDIDDTKMQEFATEAGCGEIAHIRWLTDRDSGDFKGCGFIEFGDTADVDKFVLKNGADCMGRNIRCDYAKPRAPRD